MENPNLETNDWDWELVPNSDEHNRSTDSSSFGGRGGVIRSDHFSLEGEELDNPSLVDHVNEGFNGIEHLGFSDHFAKSSEIVQNSGNNDAKIINSVTGISDHFAKSSEFIQKCGNDDVEIINSVTGISDHVAKSSEIVQSRGVDDSGIGSVTGFTGDYAKSSEIVQNSGKNDAVGISDHFAKSSEIVQNSGASDLGRGDTVTGLSDHFAESSEIVHQNSGNEDLKFTSVTGFSDHSPKSSEIVHQNCGNEDIEVPSVTKSEEIVHHNSGSDDAKWFSGECAEEQEQEQHGDCSNFEDEEGNKRIENEKRVVWWKVPMEVLKYCALRVSPVWSLSMAAAALMGFVLLRRRYLYKMKRKSMSVQVNVTVHDKKVSQLISGASRLNEAFSMVKRVPIIRPALLPAPGMASWPVMSLNRSQDP